MAESQTTPRTQNPDSKLKLLAFGALPLGLLGLGVIAAVLPLLGIVSIQVWDITNSSAFCTNSCHSVHPEEAFAYQDSFHARVTCTECHVGRIGTLREISRKATHARHLSAVVLGRYDRPLKSQSMRPANETCERCHSPSAIHDDTVRDIQRFLPDWNNTAKRMRLVLRTAAREDAGRPGNGIHWHITNRVEYIATDSQKQDIPWVQVTYADGHSVEYNDLLNPLSPEEVARADIRVMDCVDCHNRVGHPFPSPEDLVDQALADGRLSSELPFAKKEVLELVAADYASQEEALSAAGSLVQRYQTAYPKVSVTHRPAIDQAVQVTQELLTRLVFEAPGVTWRSFADNAGHDDFPGCFRCHDGNHTSLAGESIALTCTTCHSIPVTVDEGDPLPDPTTMMVDVPQSHRTATFLVDHRLLANPACESCHGEISFGSDDSSFCANSACHGSALPSLDSNAAGRHPVPLEGMHAEVTCNACHNGETEADSECASCHEPPLPKHFETACEACHAVQGFDMASQGGPEHWAALDDTHALLDCAACHSDRRTLSEECSACHLPPDGHPAGICAACHTNVSWADLQALAGASAPKVPHDLSMAWGCLGCHARADGVSPVPSDHEGFIEDQCLACHKVASSASVSLGHGETAFPLLGRHATLVCTQCHVQGLEVSLSRDCASCHNASSHQGQFGTACVLCHSPDGWEVVTFDHAQTNFPLRGQHLTVACYDCHVPAPVEGISGACFSCHGADDPHGSQFGLRCGQCHDAGGWQQASFDHAATGWQLSGAHVGAACSQCHENGSGGTAQGICSDCHQDRDVHGGQFGQACEQCHTATQWQESSFDHAQTGIVLTGEHVQVRCLACHANGNQAAGLQDCLACHADNDVHAGRFGQGCEQCHSPAGWQRAAFDHSLADFALEGAHVQVECMDCHGGDVYEGTPKRCNACHGEPTVHAGQFGTACATCHSAESWRATSFEQDHAFPLDHRESSSNTCQTCHPDGYQTYTCYGCHKHQPEEIEREHREEGVDRYANCMECHPIGKKPREHDD